MTPTDDPAAPDSATRSKRDVVITGQFKKDMKREQKGRHRATVRADLLAAVNLLADDHPLPPHMVDHPLGGTWKYHRDCHIKPDLVLIYRKSGEPSDPAAERPKLHLVRIGSHSELGL
ncbi:MULTISPECIES: type II toxin-antitoxin system YafQ family toxin [unclassified Methylobacterium]|uniref:type II toxin-antitoxin system YafQ family toxin n=1 Tax=Methylobacterium sp. J-088 TaxID=2836664 RepID=UPI0023E1E614|nr:type II toxin-antitoxin system YafQ family toxin [Methylobacterium sp. GC_Met_2]